jgi:uncharacterized membrane protein
MNEIHTIMKGTGNTLVSITSSAIAWISLRDAQMIVALVASCIAIVSGVLAALYWYYSILEKRQLLKKSKNL